MLRCKEKPLTPSIQAGLVGTTYLHPQDQLQGHSSQLPSWFEFKFCVVVVMQQASPASRIDVAASALNELSDGGVRPSSSVPGPASAHAHVDADKLADMSKSELRALAARVPGICRDKKTFTGKWIPKNCQELRNDLFTISTRTLKRPAAFKRPAAA